MSAERRHLGLYRETTDAAACADCGGECCRSGPGIASPEDLGAPDRERLRVTLIDRLASRLWAVERWLAPFVCTDRTVIDVGDVAEILFVRPALKTTGSCVFWKARTGCSIFDDRPTACRTLRPEWDGEDARCQQPTADTVSITQAWGRYVDVVREAMAATGTKPATP